MIQQHNAHVHAYYRALNKTYRDIVETSTIYDVQFERSQTNIEAIRLRFDNNRVKIAKHIKRIIRTNKYFRTNCKR